jgi:hypothetical protein
MDSRLQRDACDTGNMVTQRDTSTGRRTWVEDHGPPIRASKHLSIIDRTYVLILERLGATRVLAEESPEWPVKAMPTTLSELCDTRGWT